MIDTTVKVARALEGAVPVLPPPVGAAVTAINTTASACTAIGALLDAADGWDWPW